MGRQKRKSSVILGLVTSFSENEKSKGPKRTCEHSEKSCNNQGDSKISVPLAILKEDDVMVRRRNVII